MAHFWPGAQIEDPGILILTSPLPRQIRRSPEPGTVAMETARFEALAGNATRFVGLTIFQTVLDRDGMIEAGMRRGVNEGHERLTELLETIKK